MPSPWPAIAAAHARDAAARLPLFVRESGREVPAGSVHRDHLPALRRWPQWMALAGDGVTLLAAPPERDAALATMNATLRDEGLIVAWRNETYPMHDPASGRMLATFERAAARFWGTLTFGAHCNGYVADAQGRPTHLWIARRAWTKPTDPGLLDNLVGGGVPLGQSPAETLQREAWEEAGLQPTQLRALVPGRVIRIERDIPEGLQVEHLHVFDLALPAGVTPRNQDGEVAEFHCMPLNEALAQAASAAMTVDASLATLDFALRHGLLHDAQPMLEARMAAHWLPRAVAERFFCVQSN
jgi:8-oxo-dGTP pyrophosphatase MutT (NUDIX family)